MDGRDGTIEPTATATARNSLDFRGSEQNRAEQSVYNERLLAQRGRRINNAPKVIPHTHTHTHTYIYIYI